MTSGTQKAWNDGFKAAQQGRPVPAPQPMPQAPRPAPVPDVIQKASIAGWNAARAQADAAKYGKR
jgi:hypothetical protein